MSVDVTFLGTGDAFGHGGRLQPCFLFQTPSLRFMVDCGTTVNISLQRFGIDPNGIETILISHLHGDHFCGLPFFILDAQLHSKRRDPLVIAGPRGTEARLTQAMELMFPGSSGVQRKFETKIVEMTPDQSWSFGDVTVTPRLVQHPSGDDALALILAADGKTIAYTGDTQWFDDLAPWLSRADLLIAEAYFYEKPIKFHLSYNTLLEKLPQLGPQRTILTHMSQDMLDHLDQVEIEAAHDGMTVRV